MGTARRPRPAYSPRLDGVGNGANYEVVARALPIEVTAGGWTFIRTSEMINGRPVFRLRTATVPEHPPRIRYVRNVDPPKQAAA